MNISSCEDNLSNNQAANGGRGQGGLIKLLPAIQHYAWGDAAFIPRLLGRENPTAKPFAELWMGAHPDAPSQALAPEGAISLATLIDRDPDALLQPEIARRFAGRLPYLFKILAAASPLSLQIHPSKPRAEAGFARENQAGIDLLDSRRNYKDANHKPELIAALTEFFGLRGFRPLPEIARQIAAVPELRALAGDFKPTTAALQELYGALMTLPAGEVDARLDSLLARLTRENQTTPFRKTDREYWVLLADRIHSQGGRHDRGLFSFYLLNLVRLLPGQAMYLPAGVPHAYLQGAGVELMANSNNVLRGGLTAKSIDVAELLRNVDYEAAEPKIIAPQQISGGPAWRYPTPAEEFELIRLDLAADAPYASGRDHSADVLIVTQSEPGQKVLVTTPQARAEFVQGEVFLVPQGVDYTLRADGPATLFKATVPLPATRQPHGESAPGAFRGRRPVPLAFGTSGLRGLVTDITDLEAYINTRGFLDYLFATGGVKRGERVCVGGDLRPSTDSPDRSILRAVCRAIQDAELVVDNLGQLPTPALTYYALQHGAPSIMVTGSHIPFDRNGIKFNQARGEILKADEPGILRAVERVRQTEYARERSLSCFADDGMFKPTAVRPLPEVNPQATRAYERRYLEFFPPDALRGLRIVFYQHSAVGRDLLTGLLARLGAEVLPMDRAETFVPIDTEAISAAKLEALQSLADTARRAHGRIDALVSTDGDSDRPLVAGVDAAGQVRFISGDLLGLIVAEYLGVDAVVTPVSANDAVDLWSSARALRAEKTKIGSPYVIEGMRRAAEAGARRVVGWEANGGFLVGTPIARNGRELRALPTRDAALPLVAALAASQERRLSLVDLFDRLPRRYGRSGLLDDFPTAASRALTRKFSPEENVAIRVDFAENRELYSRENGPVQLATGDLATRLRHLRRELEQNFSPRDGFDGVTRVDTTDGIRIWFGNGDIAHVRASGNAPQLRIYAVANTPERAADIVARALREPDGILRRLAAHAIASEAPASLSQQVQQNIALTAELFARGETPEIIGTVAGSRPAQLFWQGVLDQARPSFQAREAISFHEDLPTNQAFGLLLLWQRLKDRLRSRRGSLVAFVFGDGTRSTPFTETDNGQKPAIATFVAEGTGQSTRYVSMVELALRCFVPVQQYLRRSGFDGLVVKWGDEVQIPTLDLSQSNARFENADVVRFVSLREMDEDNSKNKDWVGVDAEGRVTAFLPRRPLAEMEKLADRGLLQRLDGRLRGGVNLGSIALSYVFLNHLLEEFAGEVNDEQANRKDRPALDPEFFTALTVALMAQPAARAEAWEFARRESREVENLQLRFPNLIERLRRVIERFETQAGRPVKMVAMDFGDQYWGDVGQHTQIYEFYMALNRADAHGEIARAIAGIPSQRDGDGNIIVNSSVAPGVRARNSVLLNATLLGVGLVENSVLIGTRAGNLHARDSFDVLSTVTDLTLEPRGGTYKVVASAAVRARAGERLTTLFLPSAGAQLFRVQEGTDLKNRAQYYDAPMLGNPRSFQAAHIEMSALSMDDLAARREQEEHRALEAMRAFLPPLPEPAETRPAAPPSVNLLNTPQ